MITRIPALVLVFLKLTECSSSKCGLQFSNHTAATALGLSSQCSSKDQDSCDTPLERGKLSTLSWQGLRYSRDQMKWIAIILPKQWKGRQHIELGSYNTREAAARAYDVGIYYTNKSVAFNISSPAAFLPPFPNNLSFDKAEDSTAIREFVRKEAKNFVAMNEKAKAPSQQGLEWAEGICLGDIWHEGIVSPLSSMQAKLPMEDDLVSIPEDGKDEFDKAEQFFMPALDEGGHLSWPLDAHCTPPFKKLKKKHQLGTRIVHGPVNFPDFSGKGE